MITKSCLIKLALTFKFQLITFYTGVAMTLQQRKREEIRSRKTVCRSTAVRLRF